MTLKVLKTYPWINATAISKKTELSALSNKQNLYYEGSGNFWSGRLVNYKTLAPISTISLADLQEKFNIKFNTLVMDIEGGEFDVFSEIDFKYLKKVIFENHFTLSSNKYIIMEEILNNNNFKKKEINGRVEFWCKK